MVFITGIPVEHDTNAIPTPSYCRILAAVRENQREQSHTRVFDFKHV